MCTLHCSHSSPHSSIRENERKRAKNAVGKWVGRFSPSQRAREIEWARLFILQHQSERSRGKWEEHYKFLTKVKNYRTLHMCRVLVIIYWFLYSFDHCLNTSEIRSHWSCSNQPNLRNLCGSYVSDNETPSLEVNDCHIPGTTWRW